MKFYPKQGVVVEITDDKIKSMLSKCYGLDVEEIENIENNKYTDICYNHFKSGFICGIRETLKMVADKDLITEEAKFDKRLAVALKKKTER